MAKNKPNTILCKAFGSAGNANNKQYENLSSLATVILFRSNAMHYFYSFF